jgi:hypothetical protein
MRYTGFLAVMLVILSILTVALSLLITLRYPLPVLVDLALISLISGMYDNILVYLYQANIPLEVRARVFRGEIPIDDINVDSRVLRGRLDG